MFTASLFAQVLLAHHVFSSPVRRQQNETGSTEAASYIVKFRDTASTADIDQHISWLQNITHDGGDNDTAFGLRHRFTLTFQGYSAVLDDTTIAQVFISPEVVSIDPIGVSEPPAVSPQTGTTGSDRPPPGFRLHPISPSVHANRLFADENIHNTNLKDTVIDKPRGWNTIRLSHRKFDGGYRPGSFLHNGYLGQGTTVYVLDTGVNLQQTGFQGSDVSQPRNFVKHSSAEDLNGHGTMCAGVIAGRLTGLAPDAKLVSLKVAGDDNRSWADDVAAGIEYVIKDKGVHNNMKVISLSQVNFAGTPLVNTAIEAAIERGVHVVISAGNDNVDACGVQPANVERAIKVGSINAWDALPIKGVRPKQFAKHARSPIGSVMPNAGGMKNNNPNVAEVHMQEVEAQEAIDFAGFDTADPEGTNWGPCVTIFAPGIYVPTLSAHNISASYRYWGWGTSIAAPQVAALIAARLSEVGPTAPAVMKKWLLQQATKGQMQGDIKNSPNLIAFSGVKTVKESTTTDGSESIDAGNSGSRPSVAKLPPAPVLQQPVDKLPSGSQVEAESAAIQAVPSANTQQQPKRPKHKSGKPGHRSSSRPRPSDRDDGGDSDDERGARSGRGDRRTHNRGEDGQEDTADGPWWISWLRSLEV